MLIAWEFISQKGAWISFDEDFINLLKDNGFDCPDKIQGESKLNSFLEENSGLANFLIAYFKEIIIKEKE